MSHSMKFPNDPIAAVCAEHPSHYYWQALQGPTLYFDATLNCWVALSAELIEQIMQHPDCVVRPILARIPATLAQRPSAEFFSGIMRMNEGELHKHARQHTLACMSELSISQIDQAADLANQQIAIDMANANLTKPEHLNYFINTHAVYSLANLLGLSAAIRQKLPALVAALVSCLSPLSQAAELDAADQAFLEFFAMMRTQVNQAQADNLFARFKAHAQALEWQDFAALVINLCGWFTQSYDASRGLLSASLLRLQQFPCDHALSDWHEDAYKNFLREVCRLDAPIQNTRRYTTQAITIEGQLIPANAQILLVLAAANLDPNRYHQSKTFSPSRSEKLNYSFGLGAHHCPGQELTLRFCQRGLAGLLAIPDWQSCRQIRYQKSVNARIAIFC